MRTVPVAWYAVVFASVLATGCGGEKDEKVQPQDTSSSSGSSSSGASTDSSSSSSSSASSSASSSSTSTSSSSSSSSSGVGAASSSSGGDDHLGYTALADGKGGVNYEGVDIAALGYDTAASRQSFEATLYAQLRESNCVTCHDSETQGLAPLIADADPALAHDYALTAVNFRAPQYSKLVSRLALDRHQCADAGCATTAQAMQTAVEAWRGEIAALLTPVPRSLPEGRVMSAIEVEALIEADHQTIAPIDLPYMVYTSLHELHNEGLSAEQLNIVRVALSKSLNSVARWAPAIVNPVDITGDGMIYRFDIRDYWGYNQGVDALLFGGSDDDLAYGVNKRDFRGDSINQTVQEETYGFTNVTGEDPEHALRIWQRVLHGNVEGTSQNGNLVPNIDGFKGERSRNAAGDYVDRQDLKWVEASQLVYTLTRPDVYNAVMMNPFYADELERNLQVDHIAGADAYDYLVTLDAHTIDARLSLRAQTLTGGWYWKTFDVFTGDLASGDDRDIRAVYADPDGADIRFPFWANPIPRFVNWLELGPDDQHYSFIATLAQAFEGGNLYGFTDASTPGCDFQDGTVQGFGYCRYYTGTGGGQQSFSQVIYDLPNGLQGYYMAGGFNQRRVSDFINVERDPRRNPSASDDIAHMTGYGYGLNGESNGSGAFARAGDPRLIVGASCIGCHADGVHRARNDMRHWLDNDPAKLPQGAWGVDAWIENPVITARVRELYPPAATMNQQIEADRQGFLEAMAEIKHAMIWGEDKNLYLEPVIWTAEHAQTKYEYIQLPDN